MPYKQGDEAVKRICAIATLFVCLILVACARRMQPKDLVLPSGARVSVAVTNKPTAPSPVPTAREKPRRRWLFWRARSPQKPSEGSAQETAPAVEEPPARVYRLRTSDPVIIALRGIPGYAGGEQRIEAIVDENGEINLPLLNVVKAAGKTASELEREIRERYIREGYYRDLGVNVLVPSQSFFVRGEVRAPGRFQLVGGMTMLQALAAAGGFTEFANPRKVELLRREKRMIVNVRQLEKNPARDIELEAGDVIIVPRSVF